MAVRRVLMVCLGNICRSPVAEGVLRQRAAEAGLDLEVDSAGTAGYHQGKLADPRARATASRHGITLTHRARRVVNSDFEAFDLILAMDRDNLANLEERCPVALRGKLQLLRAYDPVGEGDVPDPYYGGDDGFELVHAMVDRSCRQLLARLAQADD